MKYVRLILYCFILASFVPTVLAQTNCTYPAQKLDLTNWKETLPIGSPGSPTEIKQPQLATFSQDPYFRVNLACDGVQFRAPTDGVTTSGSSYPRSELREMTNGGTAQASWDNLVGSGIHKLYIDQAVTRVPDAKQHIVVGQIHDSSSDVIVIRLEYPILHVDMSGTNVHTLDANYTIGKRFNVTIEAVDGKIHIYYNGSTTPVYTISQTISSSYFKAGAYTQSNPSTESSRGGTAGPNNYGEAIIYNVRVDHFPVGAPTSTIGPTLTPTFTPIPTYTPTPHPTELARDLCGYNVTQVYIPPDYANCVACMYGPAGDPSNPANQLNIPPIPGNQWTVAGCIQTTPGGFVQSVVTFTVSTIGGFMLLVLLYGGFLVLTSEGNPDKLTNGKKFITGAILALVLTLFATTIFRMVGVTILNIPGIG